MTDGSHLRSIVMMTNQTIMRQERRLLVSPFLIHIEGKHTKKRTFGFGEKPSLHDGQLNATRDNR